MYLTQDSTAFLDNKHMSYNLILPVQKMINTAFKTPA